MSPPLHQSLVVAPDSIIKSYNIDLGSAGLVDYTAKATRRSTPAYANTTNVAPISPLVTRCDMYYLMTFTPTPGNANWIVRVQIYPRIDLWNPYAVPIQVPNARVAWATSFNLTTNLYLQYNSFRPMHGFSLGTVMLNPGQSISFVPKAGQDISAINTTAMPPDIIMQPGVVSTFYTDAAYDAYTVSWRQLPLLSRIQAQCSEA